MSQGRIIRHGGAVLRASARLHIPLQFSGTSNKVNPARLAFGQTMQRSAGAGVINRTAWKYMDWLAGFNGGPLRAPAARCPDRFMKRLRKSLQESRMPVTSDPDARFMIGRYPA